MEQTIKQPLLGQVALVTGASRGIGRAIALHLAAAGARVAATARNGTDLDEVAREAAAKGGQVFPMPADVSDVEQCARLVDGAVERLGQLDILVNNAAVMVVGQTWDLTLDEWAHVMKVNLMAPFALTRAALPSMMERRKGHIVNITSSAGSELILGGLGAYGASKAGLNQFTRFAADEAAAYGVRINAVDPGVVATDMTAQVFRDSATRAAGQAMKVVPAEEPARLVEWIVTQSELNGQILAVLDPEVRRRAGFLD